MYGTTEYPCGPVRWGGYRPNLARPARGRQLPPVVRNIDSAQGTLRILRRVSVGYLVDDEYRRFFGQKPDESAADQDSLLREHEEKEARLRKWGRLEPDELRRLLELVGAAYFDEGGNRVASLWRADGDSRSPQSF